VGRGREQGAGSREQGAGSREQGAGSRQHLHSHVFVQVVVVKELATPRRHNLRSVVEKSGAMHGHIREKDSLNFRIAVAYVLQGY
jgi:hypothetical protein